MKEDAISKINKMGKAGSIITIILRIFVILGLVGTIVAALVLAVLPEDTLHIRIAGKANVDVNLASVVGKNAAEEALADIDLSEYGYEKGAELDLEGVSYGIDKLETKGSHILISGNGEMGDFNLRKLVGPLVAVTLHLIMTLITLFFIGALFKAVGKCQSPFEEDVIKKMRMFAYSLIPWVVFSSISDMASKGIFNNRVKFSLSVNFNMVFIVLMILALTYIFQYGAVLQRESDETL